MATSALAQAAGSSAPAAAQPTTVAPVTVSAAKPQVIEKQAFRFVESYAAAQNPEIGQIGRWRDPVCVQVIGLGDAGQAMVKTRIESIAQALGVPAPAKTCTPNVQVIFTDQPQKIIDMVADRREYLLGYHHVHLRNQLKAITRPIQSWYVTATKGFGEGAAPILFSNVPISVQAKTLVIDDPDNHPPTGCGDSRLTTSCLESQFYNVLIVADTKAVGEKDLGMVADYMAMLALSQPRSLDGCGPLASVLDVLAKTPCPGRDPPDGLTPADAAYLTALYATDLVAKKKVEQSDISLRMSQILIKAQTGGR